MGQRDLPLASGAKHVKAFERAGWTCAQALAKNAHFVLSKANHPHKLSIPNHKEVKRGLLAKQIKLAGLTEKEYLGYFHKRVPTNVE